MLLLTAAENFFTNKMRRFYVPVDSQDNDGIVCLRLVSKRIPPDVEDLIPNVVCPRTEPEISHQCMENACLDEIGLELLRNSIYGLYTLQETTMDPYTSLEHYLAMGPKIAEDMPWSKYKYVEQLENIILKLHC